jgi:hypothetical protein
MAAVILLTAGTAVAATSDENTQSVEDGLVDEQLKSNETQEIEQQLKNSAENGVGEIIEGQFDNVELIISTVPVVFNFPCILAPAALFFIEIRLGELMLAFTEPVRLSI